MKNLFIISVFIFMLIVCALMFSFIFLDKQKDNSCDQLLELVEHRGNVFKIRQEVGALLEQPNFIRDIGLVKYISLTRNPDWFDRLHLNWKKLGYEKSEVRISFGCLIKCENRPSFDYFKFEVRRNSILFLADSEKDQGLLPKAKNGLPPKEVGEDLFMYCEGL